MPNATNCRRHRSPEKDRFRTARRQKDRTDRKLRSPQMLFPWFLQGLATDQPGRSAT
jgi:hypothetical protein